MMGPDRIDSGIETASRLGSSFSTNPGAISALVALYLRPGQMVIDPTYGKGVFWREVDTSDYACHFSDLADDGIDFRDLPYDDDSADWVVLDPPYRYNPRTATHPEGLDGNYRVHGAPKNIQGVIDRKGGLWPFGQVPSQQRSS